MEVMGRIHIPDSEKGLKSHDNKNVTPKSLRQACALLVSSFLSTHFASAAPHGLRESSDPEPSRPHARSFYFRCRNHGFLLWITRDNVFYHVLQLTV
jgi:hypothetical protein